MFKKVIQHWGFKLFLVYLLAIVIYIASNFGIGWINRTQLSEKAEYAKHPEKLEFSVPELSEFQGEVWSKDEFQFATYGGNMVSLNKKGTSFSDAISGGNSSFVLFLRNQFPADRKSILLSAYRYDPNKDIYWCAYAEEKIPEPLRLSKHYGEPLYLGNGVFQIGHEFSSEVLGGGFLLAITNFVFPVTGFISICAIWFVPGGLAFIGIVHVVLASRAKKETLEESRP